MPEYISETISTIMDKVNKNSFLPDIQRPFVWKELDVYKLFDSLMRKYPIGTFLIWTLSKDVIEEIEKTRNISIEMYTFLNSNMKNNDKLKTRERDEYWLVLDGQQRLTTFNIVLRGFWEDKEECDKELYLNALSGDKENDDKLPFEFKFQDGKNGIFYFDADIPKRIDKIEYENNLSGELLENNARKTIEAIYSREGNYYKRKGRMSAKEEAKIKEIFMRIEFGIKAWINVKKVFEADIGKSSDKEKFYNKILEGKSIKKEKEQRIKDNINDLYQVMQEKTINYFPIREKDYDRVLDIFVRANSGGVKLGYSDLLFSRIKLNWPDARESFKKLLDDLNGNNYDFDNDFILKSYLVILADKSDDIKYSVNNFSQNKIGKMIENWKDIKSSFEFTIDKLDEYIINSPKLIPSYNALIPIIYWKFKNKYKSLSGDRDLIQLSNIRTWLIKALLSGVFGGQSDNILYKCKQVIDENSEVFPADIIESAIESSNKSMELKENIIDGYKYNSKESYLFLSVIYKNSIQFKPRYKKNLPEQDHIFCKAELKTAGITDDKINSIYNIRYVPLYDNRTKLDDPFNEWVEGLGSKRGEVFKTHMIPEGNWDISSFEEFINERKKLLLQQIQYVGLLKSEL